MRKFGNTNFAAYDKENPVYVNGASLARKLRVAFSNDDPYMGILFEDGKIVYIDINKEVFSTYLKEVDGTQVDKETGAKAVKAASGKTKEEIKDKLEGKTPEEEPKEVQLRKFSNTDFSAYESGDPVFVNGATLARKLRIAFEDKDQYMGIEFADGKIIYIDVEKEEFSNYLKEEDASSADKETGSKAVKVAIGHTKEEVEQKLSGKYQPKEEDVLRKFSNSDFSAYDQKDPPYLNASALARKVRIAFEEHFLYMGIKFENGKIVYIDARNDNYADYLAEKDGSLCDKETGSGAVKAVLGWSKEEIEKELNA